MTLLSPTPYRRARAFLSLAPALLFFFALVAPARAQTLEEGVHPVVRADGSVYLVHTLSLGPNERVEVYRSLAGGAEARRAQAPLRPVASGAAMQTLLGAHADEVRARLRAGTMQEAYLKLRTQPIAGALYSYLYPSVAEALGRSFLDADVPLGGTATYRLVVVDDVGRPTGREVSATVPLTPFTSPAPENLRAEHAGRLVTLAWSYPTSHPEEVVAFHVYAGAPGEQPRRVDAPRVTRNQAEREFSVTFEVSRFGAASYFVTAQDLSGQEGPPSPVLAYEVTDNEAPGAIAKIFAKRHPRGGLTVSWSEVNDLDVSTYRIFRARQIAGPYKVVAEVSPTATSYRDTSAVEGRLYAYRVAAVDAAGNAGPPSVAGTVQYEDRSPPAPPADLKATPQGDSLITLQWTRSPAADLRTYVLLRRRLGRGGVRVDARLNGGDVTDLRFADNGEAGQGFVEGATYVFGVAAVDSARNASDTVYTRVKVPDLTPPAPPKKLLARTDGFRVRLTWSPSGSADVARYRLYRATGDSTAAPALLRELKAGTTFTRDQTAEPGTAYRYRLTAVDADGNESRPSRPATILMRDDAPPRRVRGVRAASEASGVALAWEASSASDLAGYHVFRATEAAGTYERLTETPLPSPAWTDPSGKTALWYVVRAIDTSGHPSRPSKPVQAR